MKKQVCGKIFIKIPTQLKSSLKLKFFLLLAKAVTTTDDSESANWQVFRDYDGIYAIAPNGKYYKIRPKLILLLAKAIAIANESESVDWRVFRGPDGIYAIQPDGKYYKISINVNGDLKLYRGKNRIYLGKHLNQGYFEASKSSSCCSDWN